MDTGFYFEMLYPLQDRVLAAIGRIETEFHLSGGTAASRGYLHHRVSDDLDLFVNDDDRFDLWSARVIEVLAGTEAWACRVDVKDPRFARLTVVAGDVPLKVELINDVPGRVGVPWRHPVLGLLDTAENILANKVSAVLDREAPKDLADIWGFCCRMGLSIDDAIEGAQGKAAGVFPADLARVLYSATEDDWSAIGWIEAPEAGTFVAELRGMVERLVVGRKRNTASGADRDMS